jgi:hypothetical protein
MRDDRRTTLEECAFREQGTSTGVIAFRLSPPSLHERRFTHNAPPLSPPDYGKDTSQRARIIELSKPTL